MLDLFFCLDILFVCVLRLGDTLCYTSICVCVKIEINYTKVNFKEFWLLGSGYQEFSIFERLSKKCRNLNCEMVMGLNVVFTSYYFYYNR